MYWLMLNPRLYNDLLVYNMQYGYVLPYKPCRLRESITGGEVYDLHTCHCTQNINKNVRLDYPV